MARKCDIPKQLGQQNIDPQILVLTLFYTLAFAKINISWIRTGNSWNGQIKLIGRNIA